MSASLEPVDFPEWRVVRLLERHCFGCTQWELIHFLSLEPEAAGTALSRLQAAGAVVGEPYARGRLFSLVCGDRSA